MAGQGAAPEAPESEVTTTLDEDLRAALMAANKEPEVVEPEPDETPDESDTPDDADEPDEVETEESDDDEGSEAPDEDGDDEPGEAIVAPEHWSEGDKKAFASLPEAGRKFILRRHKEMEADYTRKTQEVAPLRKALEPFKGEMQRLGINEAQAMSHITTAAQQLWGYQQQLQQNPKAVIEAIAKSYGVDLGATNKADEYIDPEIARLRQEVSELRGLTTQERQQRALEAQRTVAQQIADFAATHPHTEQLEGTMAALINAGQATTLDDAYEKAQWSHPEIRQQILADQQAERDKQAEAQRKDKVKRARTAGKAVTTTNPAAPKKQESSKSIGDTLREELTRHINNG